MEQNQTNQYNPEYIEKWNSYFDLANNVLKNKLGITNQDDLEVKSAEITFGKLTELYLDPIQGNFDQEHLKAIHRYLFDELYDWAGEYRIVSMRRDNQSTYFCTPERIPELLKIEINELNKKVARAHSKIELATALGEGYVNIQNVHPFREGNSRTIREYFRQYVLEKTPLLPMGPMELDLTAMDPKIMVTARTFIAAKSPGEIIMEFYKALKPVTLTETEEIKSEVL